MRSFSKSAPNRQKALDDKLADVLGRIKTLVANCETQVVPEIEARLAELRSERESIQAEQRQLLADDESKKGPPTRAWIEERLSDLRSALSEHGPAAAHALRALVGGRIVVTEIRRPGKQRHYLRGRMEVRLRDVGETMGAKIVDGSESEVLRIEIIEIDFRRPERYEQIADEVKRLWDDGLTDKEIAKKVNCGRALIPLALDHWYEQRGLVRPDGRSLKKRLKNRRKADKCQAQIMELWHQDLSVNEIARRLGCCLEIVHEAVTKWHLEGNLPVPDGRARRRQIRLKNAS